MEARGVDLVQQLLTAAANLAEWQRRWPDKKPYPDLEGKLIAAARNGLRALAEEWLRYGGHDDECFGDCVLNPGMPPLEYGKCTCGWEKRQTQLREFVKMSGTPSAETPDAPS